MLTRTPSPTSKAPTPGPAPVEPASSAVASGPAPPIPGPSASQVPLHPGPPPVPRLADITHPSAVPEPWVHAYLGDLGHHETHLYESDIDGYLRAKVGDEWMQGVRLQNTGGNHWDVHLSSPDGKQSAHVATRRDGNCAAHTVAAVRNRDALLARGGTVSDYEAAPEQIEEVRAHAHAALLGDHAEVRQRIAMEAQRSPSIPETGFGPQLRHHLEQAERIVRPGPPAVPERPYSEDDRQGATSRVLQLEHGLMDLVDAHHLEKHTITQLQAEFAPHVSAAKAAHAAPEQAEQLQQKLAELRGTYGARLQPVVDQRKAAESALGGRKIGDLRTEWMGHMEQLLGTHPQGPAKTYFQRPARRHDDQPGVYGREPTAEDADVSGKQLEVLHGHGTWYRTGLLARGSGPDRMPGTTSLREIADRANERRKESGKPPIDVRKLELSFVTPHGIPATGEAVRGGGAPDVKPVREDVLRELMGHVEAYHSAKKKPDVGLDEFVHKRCQVPDPTHVLSKSAQRQGYVRRTVFSSRGKQVHEAYQRMKAGTLGGRPGRYAEVLTGAEHADTPIPDLSLSLLMGSTALENSFADEASGSRVPGHRMSLWEDLKPDRSREGRRDDGRDVKDLAMAVRMSDAMTHRLSALSTVDEPVRTVWAACRSEQLPHGFDDRMFQRWITDAAEQRRRQRDSH